MYKYFIAIRYLRSRWINYLAMAAVAVAVTANLVVISILSGFLQETNRNIKSVNGDLIIVAKSDFYAYEHLLHQVRETAGVESASPYLNSICMVSGTATKPDHSEFYFQKPCHFKGVNLEDEIKVNKFFDFLTEIDGRKPDFTPGEVPQSTTPGKLYPTVLVGDKFISEYNEETHLDDNLLQINDLITIYTVPMSNAKEKIKAQRKTFRVGGFFNTGLWEADSNMLLISLDMAQLLRKMQSSVDGISIKIKPEFKRADVQNLLQETIYNAYVKTWEDMDAISLGNATFQLKIMRVIMFFLLLLTGFMIMALLTTSVYQKFREIGILKAMGATTPGITAIFFMNGVFICLAGSMLGMGFGMAILTFINPICDTILAVTGYEVFPTAVYYMSHVPVDFNPSNAIMIISVGMLTSALASIVPAVRAGAMDPVQALYYE